MKKYKLIYWVNSQDKEFFNPRRFETDSKEEYEKALERAKDAGYEIEYATTQDVESIYKDLLNTDIEKAAKDYEKAKVNAIQAINRLTPKKATAHAGELLKVISDIVRAAERLETLDDAFMKFEYTNYKANHQKTKVE